MIHVPPDLGPLLLLAALILGAAFGLRLVILSSLRGARRRRRLELESAYERYDRVLSGSMADASAPCPPTGVQ